MIRRWRAAATTTSSDDPSIVATHDGVERVVIGLHLYPSAPTSALKRLICYATSDADTPDTPTPPTLAPEAGLGLKRTKALDKPAGCDQFTEIDIIVGWHD